MRVSLLITGAMLVASLALVALVVAPPAGAADQPTGTGAAAQTEVVKERADIQPEQRVAGELGKGSEQPMRVPNLTARSDFLIMTPERQIFTDPDILEHMRHENEKSAVAQ